MTTVDLINEERRRYLRSGRTRRDWVRYVVAIESIRRRPDTRDTNLGTGPPTGTPGPVAFAAAPA